jgi:hypothetical protein
LSLSIIKFTVDVVAESESVKTVPVAVVDSPVIDTVESNQFTVLAVWSIVAKDISSAPS